MKRLLLCLLAAGPLLLNGAAPAPMHKPYGLVIHGGAGVIRREDLPPALEAEYRAQLAAALAAGYAVLDGGGSALDAVVAAIRVLED